MLSPVYNTLIVPLFAFLVSSFCFVVVIVGSQTEPSAEILYCLFEIMNHGPCETFYRIVPYVPRFHFVFPNRLRVVLF